MSLIRVLVSFGAIIVIASGCIRLLPDSVPNARPPDPNRAVADIGWFKDADTAERAALRQLSAMIARRPSAPRYQIIYAYEGTHFGGEVPHIWDYNPRSGNLQDTYDANKTVRGRLKNVTATDIHRFAKHFGTFSRLEVYTKRKRKDRR